jgi:hypothetical protein
VNPNTEALLLHFCRLLPYPKTTDKDKRSSLFYRSFTYEGETFYLIVGWKDHQTLSYDDEATGKCWNWMEQHIFHFFRCSWRGKQFLFIFEVKKDALGL